MWDQIGIYIDIVCIQWANVDGQCKRQWPKRNDEPEWSCKEIVSCLTAMKIAAAADTAAAVERKKKKETTNELVKWVTNQKRQHSIRFTKCGILIRFVCLFVCLIVCVCVCIICLAIWTNTNLFSLCWCVRLVKTIDRQETCNVIMHFFFVYNVWTRQ